MDRLEVREFVPQESREDLELLLPAYLDIWNEPENLKFLSFTLKPFEEGIVRGWLSRHLSGNVRYFAALEGGMVSGMAAVRADPVEGFEIIGMGVRRGRKGRGIGASLVRHAVDVASSEGFGAVDAWVFADNPAMLRLLLSLSFVPVAMDHNRRADNADMVRMRRTR